MNMKADEAGVAGVLRIAIQLRSRLFREAIAARLDHEPDLRVVGTTACMTDLPRLCGLRNPDVLVFEAGIFKDDLAALIIELRLRHQLLYVIGLHDRLDPEQAERVLCAGVSCLVAESSGVEALLSAVRQPAWSGSSALSGLQRRAGLVTDTELRILRLVGSGYTREQVASVLGVTPRAVDNYKRRIFTKLDAQGQAHAAAYAARFGLLRSGATSGRLAVSARQRERPAVALLAGRYGTLAGRVAEILLRQRIPLIIDRSGLLADTDHPARLVRGVLIAVLVDPEPSDWPAGSDLACCTLAVLSREPGQAQMAEMVLRGADALLTAARLADTLLPAFRLVAEGYLLVDAIQGRRFIGAGCARLSGPQPGVPLELTMRERQILGYIERGHSVKQTARALGISVKTVESQQSGLFRKLGIHSRAEALVVAHGLGLMPP